MSHSWTVGAVVGLSSVGMSEYEEALRWGDKVLMGIIVGVVTGLVLRLVDMIRGARK